VEHVAKAIQYACPDLFEAGPSNAGSGREQGCWRTEAPNRTGRQRSNSASSPPDATAGLVSALSFDLTQSIGADRRLPTTGARRSIVRCVSWRAELEQMRPGVHPKSETLRMLQSSRGGRDEETRPTIIERRETCDSFSD
jgi:hypothetical protein